MSYAYQYVFRMILNDDVVSNGCGSNFEPASSNESMDRAVGGWRMQVTMQILPLKNLRSPRNSYSPSKMSALALQKRSVCVASRASARPLAILSVRSNRRNAGEHQQCFLIHEANTHLVCLSSCSGGQG